MALHEQSIGKSDSWYTPPRVFTALGCTFDVDVASPGADITPWIPANRFITEDEDGLLSDWCNYSFFALDSEGLSPWKDDAQNVKDIYLLVLDISAQNGINSTLSVESAFPTFMSSKENGSESTREDLGVKLVRLSSGARYAKKFITLRSNFSTPKRRILTASHLGAATVGEKLQESVWRFCERLTRSEPNYTKTITTEVLGGASASESGRESIMPLEDNGAYISLLNGASLIGSMSNSYLAINAHTAEIQPNDSIKTTSFLFPILNVQGPLKEILFPRAQDAISGKGLNCLAGGLKTILDCRILKDFSVCIVLVERSYVWANAPFGGRNGLIPWLDKFVEHGNGIALVPDRTSAPWWQNFVKRAETVLFVSPKLKFLGRNGQPGNSPPQGTCLVGIGREANFALDLAAEYGLGTLLRVPEAVK